MRRDKYFILRDREGMFSPGYWNLIVQTSPSIQKIHGIEIERIFAIFKSGRMIQFYIMKNIDKTADVLSKKLFNNTKYFNNINKKYKRVVKDTEKFIRNIKDIGFSKLDFQELIKLIFKIQRVWLNYDIVSITPWVFGGDKFKEKVEEYLKIPPDNFNLLTTPKEKTQIAKLDYALLKYTKLIKGKSISLEKAAEKLSEYYGSIPFGYDGLEYWDKKYFIKKLKRDVKNDPKIIQKQLDSIIKADAKNLKNKRKIIKKYRLNKKAIKLIDIINIFAVWTDERKQLDYKLHYYYSKILLEFSRRYKIPYKNLKYLFIEELKNIEKNKKEVVEKSNQRIKNEFIIEFKKGKGRILSSREKNEILRQFKKQKEMSRVEGIVVSKGPKKFYTGKVKIILSPKDCNKVKKGEFLVATMTTPDYISGMKKAKGFITNEGGMTCHAAIVAREMNKPCVIGTRNATEILEDGSIIAINTDKSIAKIKIIKSKI